MINRKELFRIKGFCHPAVCWVVLILLGILASAPCLAIKKDFQVNDDDDDAEETVSSGAMDLGSTDLELISEGGTAQIVGFRFRDVTIPQGMTITSAILEFETDETDSGSTSLTFRGEDVDDAAIFSTSNSDISNRTTTTASVAWSPGAWNTVNERHRSPDVSAIVQEVVDRVGWSSGNSMVFIVSGSGERTAESHDGESSAAPILRLEWDGQESIPGGRVCYGVADSNDHFILIDTTDGTVDTDIGDTNFSSVEAITLDPDDFAVYGADRDRLGRINVDTGEMIDHPEDFGTGGGSAGSITFDDVDSLAFDPATGILWGVDARGGSDALFQIDIDTGAHVADAFGVGTDYVLISGTGIGGSIDDIAIDPSNGTLYASDTTNSQLITVNTTTGAGTIVGGFGSVIDIEGLGFRFDGVLYGTSEQRLYTLNTSTGAATQVGSGDTLTPPSDFEAFECHFTATSRAVLRSFERITVGGRPAVRWTTAAEDGAVGFRVARWQEGEARWRGISAAPVPALAGEPQGGTYVLADPGGGAGLYALLEIEASGRWLRHGPFALGATGRSALSMDDLIEDGHSGDDPAVGDDRVAKAAGLDVDSWAKGQAGAFAAWAHPRQRAPVERSTRAVVDAELASVDDGEPQQSRRGAGAAIRVGETGLYRISIDQISDVIGGSHNAARKLLRAGRLALEQGGEAVAWTPAADGDGLVFYGEAPVDPLPGAASEDGPVQADPQLELPATPRPLVSDPFVTHNVYRLRIGPGLAMESMPGASVDPGGIPEHTFLDTHREEVDVFAGIAASPNPDGDYWFWHGFSAGTPGYESRDLVLHLAEVAGSGSEARLAVDLFAISQAGPHLLRLELNGHLLAEEDFEGRGPRRLEVQVPADLLRTGANDLRLTALLDPAAEHSFFYLDGVDITYSRTYRSTSGRTLAFLSRPDLAVRLKGFSSSDISVFDVQDARRPKVLHIGRSLGSELPGLDRPVGGGPFDIAIRGLGAERRCLAATAAGLATPEIEPWSVASPSLADSRRRGELLILAPTSLRESARRWAEYRRADGLEVEVVELEQAYNELAHGLETPWAIRELLHTALENWQLPPRYVLLLGRGTFDHGDVLGVGDQLLPPLLAIGPGGIFPAQTRYLPAGAEVAIGRLPVVDAEQAYAYLERVQAHEEGAASGRGLMVADAPAADADFLTAAQVLGRVASRHVRTELLEIAPRAGAEELVREMAAGLDWLSFVGHGATTSWGGEGFFGTQDLGGSSGRRPIALAATCLTNRSDLPGIPSLGEALVLSPEAGAMAVLGPAGTTAHSEATTFMEHFWRTFHHGGRARLGDHVLEARQSYARVPGSGPFLKTLSLLGDPSLRVPPTSPP